MIAISKQDEEEDSGELQTAYQNGDHEVVKYSFCVMFLFVKCINIEYLLQ